jgi:hypothetical protein
MLRKGQYGLQMETPTGWKYVYCYNPSSGIVTTDNSRLALPGADLSFFQTKFGNRNFRSHKLD